MDADVIEELIRWFRQTQAGTRFGEIGFVVTKHEGQPTSVKRIFNETHRVEPKAEAPRPR